MLGWQSILNSLRRTPERSQWLGKCADALGLRVNAVAEIGVFQGGLSVNLRKQFPEAHLYLVDPWGHIPELKALRGRMHRRGGTAEGNQRYWDQVLAGVRAAFKGDDRVTFIRKISRGGAADIPDGSLDIAYIDADHRYEYVVEDIKLWMPKVRQGGILAGHDYKAVRARKVLYQAYAAVNDTLGQENIVSGRQMTWVYVKP